MGKLGIPGDRDQSYRFVVNGMIAVRPPTPIGLFANLIT